MLARLATIWERFVFGPDNDAQPRRSDSIQSVSSMNSVSPVREKSGAGGLIREKEAIGFADEDKATKVTRQQPSTRIPRWQALWKTSSFGAHSGTSWFPTFFQISPLAGLVGLCVTIGCVFASLAILVVSDGQPIDSWAIEPTVFLAIVAAIANSALRLGRAQAIPISWWYKASRGGTIRSLERVWGIQQQCGTSNLPQPASILLGMICIRDTR